MYSCKITIVAVNTNGETETKDFNGVNQSYIGDLSTSDGRPAPVRSVPLPGAYTSFWAWADAVARGINSLTTNSYNDCRIQAVFSANQEVA